VNFAYIGINFCHTTILSTMTPDSANGLRNEKNNSFGSTFANPRYKVAKTTSFEQSKHEQTRPKDAAPCRG